MIRKMIRRITVVVMTLVLLWSAVSQISPSNTAYAAPSFAKGADISWVAGMEARGHKWKDKNGYTRDILNILKWDYQINSVRLRVWVNPNMSDYYNGYMNADTAAKLAQRAKALGMSVMLTLHYSDSWADPGQQNKPYAWTSFSFNQLMDAVYSHTQYVMNTMKNYGVTPDWVQIGNETNNGMLWHDGRATYNMRNYAWLITTGNNAVKSIFPNATTIVHLANGEDNNLYVWNIGGLLSNGAKFDVIGMSLYPSTSDWQTKADQTIWNANNLISRYGKSVMISEIGMEYSAPSTSKAFISYMKDKARAIPRGKGLGVFYWEPQSTPGWNGYNKGAWYSDGKPTIALEGFWN